MTMTETGPTLNGGNWPANMPPPPPPPPSRKASATRILALIGGLILVGLLVVGIAGAMSNGGLGGASHTVTYLVEGTTNMASITYENAGGDTSQQSDIDVPLRRKSDGGEGIVLSDMKSGAFLYISAQNSQGSGSVTCAIEVDGVRVKENTSRGAYTIATCSGRL